MPKGNFTTALSLVVAAAVIGAVACTSTRQPGAIKPMDGNENPSYVDPPVAGTRLTDDQKRKYLKAKRMSAAVRQRCIAGQYEVHVRCNQTVPVRITAVEGAKYVSADAAPGRPQLLAWIENLSPLYTTFDSIKPGNRARYALVAMTTMSKTGGGPARPQLLLVEFDLSWNLVAAHPWSNIFPCHLYGQPYRSEADFRPCTVEPAPARKTSLWKSEIRFASLSAPTAQYYADDPIWFSCSGGCCTSGNHGVQTYQAHGLQADDPLMSAAR